MASPRIAVCQEWVMTWSGSDQVAGRLAEALDADDVYTYAGLSELIDRLFPGRRVHTSRLGRSSFARRHWAWLLPFMSSWWRSLDLDTHDAVVTCSHSTVNSVRARPDAVHVSYCCTPMRYAWMWRSEFQRVPRPLRPVWPLIAAGLRWGDRRRARNVDLFLADSANVAARIDRFYGRRSIVVYPPVDTDRFTPDSNTPKEDFFLYAGRLIGYKRPDLAVQAAERAGVRLVVAGSGPELDRLRSMAGPGVEFRVQPSDEDLRDLYRRARALVFAGVEDFGMVLVEAQACGTPVIAYAAGGALEAVRPDTGLLYNDPSLDGLAQAIGTFDPAAYDPAAIRRHAERFGADRFDAVIRRIVGALTEASPTERQGVVGALLAEHGAAQ